MGPKDLWLVASPLELGQPVDGPEAAANSLEFP